MDSGFLPLQPILEPRDNSSQPRKCLLGARTASIQHSSAMTPLSDHDMLNTQCTQPRSEPLDDPAKRLCNANLTFLEIPANSGGVEILLLSIICIITLQPGVLREVSALTSNPELRRKINDAITEIIAAHATMENDHNVETSHHPSTSGAPNINIPTIKVQGEDSSPCANVTTRNRSQSISSRSESSVHSTTRATPSRHTVRRSASVSSKHICDQCGKLYIRKGDLDNHVVITHPDHHQRSQRTSEKTKPIQPNHPAEAPHARNYPVTSSFPSSPHVRAFDSLSDNKNTQGVNEEINQFGNVNSWRAAPGPQIHSSITSSSQNPTLTTPVSMLSQFDGQQLQDFSSWHFGQESCQQPHSRSVDQTGATGAQFSSVNTALIDAPIAGPAFEHLINNLEYQSYFQGENLTTMGLQPNDADPMIGFDLNEMETE